MESLQREKVCDACRFELWLPLGTLPSSAVGLYDDSRFPGRTIVALTTGHYDFFEELPENVLNAFMKDVQTVARAIKKVTGASRVNVAILGNAVGHVHAHLIPRYPDMEEFPNKSPWDDTRKKTPLNAALKQQLVEALKLSLR